METITLTTPEIVQPQITTTAYWPTRITADRDAAWIVVLFKGTNGEQREWRMTGDVAVDRIRALETGDFSTVSLPRRLMEWAIADGFLDGTISGSPD